jgi:hypothetical protein
MFHCDSCHTEYGGIRGLPAGICPRCRERQGSAGVAAGASPQTVTAPPSAPRAAVSSSFRVFRTAPRESLPTRPLVGEIARLDRAVRL